MGYVRSRLSTHFSNCRGKVVVDMAHDLLKVYSGASTPDAKQQLHNERHVGVDQALEF